jgi:hypothetical protein
LRFFQQKKKVQKQYFFWKKNTPINPGQSINPRVDSPNLSSRPRFKYMHMPCPCMSEHALFYLIFSSSKDHRSFTFPKKICFAWCGLLLMRHFKVWQSRILMWSNYLKQQESKINTLFSSYSQNNPWFSPILFLFYFWFRGLL